MSVQVEVRAPEAGVITAFFGKLEDTLNVKTQKIFALKGSQVGQNFFEIDTAAAPSGGAAQPKAEKKQEAVATPKSEAPKAEAPKAEAPKAEAPKAEAPKKAESKPAQQASIELKNFQIN